MNLNYIRSPSPERKLVKKLKLNSENQHESSSSGPPQYNRVKGKCYT